jgi:tRNA threonylcarbamoyladenosine biosynthesis protein TsaB
MNILALDTATEACSVALLNGGSIQVDYLETSRDHSRLILKMIDNLLAESGITPRQLDGLAFGRGPGSFTGVRIATAVVQGIAFAIDRPVVPVSNLAAIAQRSYRESGHSRVLTAIDARMGEVYWAAYLCGDGGLMQSCLDECVTAPESVPLPEIKPDGNWVGAGTGWCSYQPILLSATQELPVTEFEHQLPHARDILALAQAELKRGLGVSAERVRPAYLRDKVAKTSIERAG